MPDLISREYVLTEYDRQHQGPPGGARKIMEEAPAVDAIPVEWLMDLANRGDFVYSAVTRWKYKQEAQK